MTFQTTPLDSATLSAGLAALFASGEVLTDKRKLNVPPVAKRFQKGHKRNPLYSVDECAVINALAVLGFTHSAIKQVTKRALPKRPTGTCHATIRAILSGPRYAETRKDPAFIRRTEHYITFFENVVSQQPGWQPGVQAFAQARAEQGGSRYKPTAAATARQAEWTDAQAEAASAQRLASAAAKRAQARALTQ
jgi:hypothetical protein